MVRQRSALEKSRDVCTCKVSTKNSSCWTAGSSSSPSPWLSFFLPRQGPGSTVCKMWLSLYFSLCWLMMYTLPLHLSIWGVLRVCQLVNRVWEADWICWQIAVINQDQRVLSKRLSSFSVKAPHWERRLALGQGRTGECWVRVSDTVGVPCGYVSKRDILSKCSQRGTIKIRLHYEKVNAWCSASGI